MNKPAPPDNGTREPTETKPTGSQDSVGAEEGEPQTGAPPNSLPSLLQREIANGPHFPRLRMYGAIADPDVLYALPYWPSRTDPSTEEAKPRRLAEKVFETMPTGSRVKVVLDEPPEVTEGGLTIPDTYRDATKMGAGIIVAAGPEAGVRDDLPSPGAPATFCPEDLLYLHVLFGAHMGAPLRYTLLDRMWKSVVMEMSIRDIWEIDLRPEHKTGLVLPSEV